MIKFRCKNCNQKIGVRDELSGKRVKCPKCKNIIIIPKIENVPLATSQNTSSDLKTDAKTSEFDLSLLDIPQDVRAPSQATARESASDQTSEDRSEAEDETASEAGQAVGERKLPWLIDIFLYPISTPGLIILAIIIIIPLLIDFVATLLGPFGFFISIPGFFFIKIPVGLYLFWYLAECIRDSAAGGLRAPETLANTPGVGEMFWQLIKIVGCLAFFSAPMLIYFLHTKNVDTIFWSLLAYAIFFFPMSLLAVVMFDSFSGLNPLLLIGSMFSTFFQYCGLLVFFCVLAWLTVMTAFLSSQSWILSLVSMVAFIYLAMVAAHLLGRFYWRHKNKLDWGL